MLLHHHHKKKSGLEIQRFVKKVIIRFINQQRINNLSHCVSQWIIPVNHW